MISTVEIEIDFKDGEYYKDITKNIHEILENEEYYDGLCIISSDNKKTGITLNERNEFLIEDIRKYIEKINKDKLYIYHENAFAHLRALVLGRSISAPVKDSKINEGVFVWNFEEKKSSKTITVSLII